MEHYNIYLLYEDWDNPLLKYYCKIINKKMIKKWQVIKKIFSNKKMKICFFCFILLIIIVNSYITRDISISCKIHKNPSIKNCGIFSINDDYRCCFSNWPNLGTNSLITNQNNEWIFLENKKK